MLVVAPATRATVTAKRLSVVGWCHCSSAVVGRCQPGAKKIVVVVVVVVVVEVVPCTIQLLLQPIFFESKSTQKMRNALLFSSDPWITFPVRSVEFLLCYKTVSADNSF